DPGRATAGPARGTWGLSRRGRGGADRHPAARAHGTAHRAVPGRPGGDEPDGTMTGRVAPETEGRAIRWARLYDLGTTLLYFGRRAALHRRVVELASIAPGERILDVGCGPGRLALAAGAVTGTAGEVCGIDPAPEMIALARRKATQLGVRARFDVAVIGA